MKLVQINTVCGSGSTGKICVGISRILNAEGIENQILYSVGNTAYPQGIKCTEPIPRLQAVRSRLLGNYGFNSHITTKRIIEELDRMQPDVVHLHNLHGHNCNLEILMNYFRTKKIRLIWTFHDCWAFTAYCPHFIMAKCDKWKTGCHHCVQTRTFSWFMDRSKWLYQKKKNACENLDLTIVTPSKWLADLVNESFLKDYPVKVINNGVDLEIFRPRPSNFREQYNIPEDRFILLGVATKWVPRKGADVLVRLAERLEAEKFQLVLVGTDENMDAQLPDNVISIHHTENQEQLAEIYSAADLFVNPTREEVLGLVNIESLACGTPVVTFRTGGSPECIDEKTGTVVDCDDEETLYREILRIAAERPFSAQNCVERAATFEEKRKYKEYLGLYLDK
ncbi:MAG: glycosyltransferase [Oscillospiraceae bacterium]|nr:glycosyltransferase [Oscillospiraceae bacterium]